MRAAAGTARFESTRDRQLRRWVRGGRGDRQRRLGFFCVGRLHPKAHGCLDGVFAGRRWCAVTAVDRIIRWSTTLAVVGVAAVAAVVSYEQASTLVRAHGESGRTGRLIPLTVDGLIYASSMVMLDSARRWTQVPALARWLLGLGIAATLAANVTHSLGHAPSARRWPHGRRRR
jgi:Protein of unknown function (DUF2637)